MHLIVGGEVGLELLDDVDEAVPMRTLTDGDILDWF